MNTGFRRRRREIGLEFATGWVCISIMLLCVTTSAQGADINAASCSQSSVQGAINAAANGDRVIVPAGTCTWSSTVSTSGKAITLQGAGVDQTTIVSGITNAPSLSTGGISSGLIRVTGFTFNGNNTSKGGNAGEINFGNGNGLDRFRFDHIKMVNLGNRGFFIHQDGNDVSGLIDHFTCIKSTSNSVQCVTVDGSSPQSRVPFSRPLSLGTNHAVYIEDSTFQYSTENDGALDAYNGARYVFRHNTMIGTTIGHHGADSGDGAGMAGFEVYANTITNPGPNSVSRIMFWRSGVGVVFDNVATGPYSGGINAKTYRSCASFSYWGQCNGSSAWDQNLPGQQGAACVDSVGHQFTENQGGANTLWGYYSWNNTLNGSRADTGIDTDCAAASVHLQINREIYNQVMPFTGATGIGRGPVSARPSTCTPITGYFATDTNTLYRCSSTNAWTPYYTPYPYPHHLQGSSSPSPPPATPTNVIVQ